MVFPKNSTALKFSIVFSGAMLHDEFFLHKVYAANPACVLAGHTPLIRSTA